MIAAEEDGSGFDATADGNPTAVFGSFTASELDEVFSKQPFEVSSQVQQSSDSSDLP